MFDLADLESVRQWAARAQDFGLALDVLVNNAGVMACPEARTADGFEQQLGVNHLVRLEWRLECAAPAPASAPTKKKIGKNKFEHQTYGHPQGA